MDPSSTGQQIGAHATEGKNIRQLVKAFDVKKRAFANQLQDMKLDMPSVLDKIHIPRKLVSRELTMTKYVNLEILAKIALTRCSKDMKDVFDPCVDNVVELVLGQVQQVEKTENQVKVSKITSMCCMHMSTNVASECLLSWWFWRVQISTGRTTTLLGAEKDKSSAPKQRKRVSLP